jgi:hypothetical protein
MGMRWAGYVARMRKTRNSYKILVKRQKAKNRSYVSYRCGWKDNIKM